MPFRSWVSGLFVGIGIGATWAPLVAGFSLGLWTFIPLGISLAGAYVSWRQYRDAQRQYRDAQIDSEWVARPLLPTPSIPLDEAALRRIEAVIEEEMQRVVGEQSAG